MMSLLTKIPFGLQLESNELVDVDDVDKGRKCGCICPSCKSALIARQGDVNIHHFSHVKSDVVKECEYNLLFSSRMMYLKLLSNLTSLSFITPSLSIKLDGYTQSQRPLYQQNDVTYSQEIELQNIRTECEVNGRIFDCVAEVKSTSIAIQFSYKERPEIIVDENDGIAVINIDLTPIGSLIWSKEPDEKYSDILMRYFVGEDADKKWLYHPRSIKVKQQTEVELRKRIVEANQRERKTEQVYTGTYCANTFQVMPKKTAVGDYYCKQCHTRWARVGGYICPKCHSPCRE
ncbi:hypothetical protein [Photobacterium phosphoreum]|uniref:competence protein CoiA family protein n=1 Tax=Photobacterium phosphoreum TaxID=659 RepID=UPI0012EA5039|nr:hypothetical protein [Photobacterium phosphoreum]